MTIDWFVLLTPVVLLVVALPLLFVGCAKFGTTPGEPPAPPPPPPQDPPTPGTTPPTPPPLPPPKTTFRLEMDANLQGGGLPSPVVQIDVSWSVEAAGGTPGPLTLPLAASAVIKSAKPPPPAQPPLDPLTDPGAVESIESATIGARDRVRCICVVTLENGNHPQVQGTGDRATLKKDSVHEFRIKSRRPANNGFEVYFNGA
ncbi:MAG TPA: hypothetical protein VJT84_05170 [Gaiellaceae bacterium]|nr:hypothetical protein [Gaiellaceae bacterium]